jgi:hypothetical protein
MTLALAHSLPLHYMFAFFGPLDMIRLAYCMIALKAYLENVKKKNMDQKALNLRSVSFIISSIAFISSEYILGVLKQFILLGKCA